jgi:tripartite ATP-independent transporter DctP family solute receptor
MNKFGKKVITLTLLAVAALTVSACGGGYGGTAAKSDNKATTTNSAPVGEDKYKNLGKYTIKFANWFGETHPQNQAIKKLAEEVNKKSYGHLKIEVYPNNQLGSEDVYIDSIKQGTVEMGTTGTMMAEYSPGINVAECPFLFSDWEHAKKTLGGPVGQKITKDLQDKCGIRCLAWTANGFREVSSSKPVTKVEDLQDMRLRVPNTPLYIQTFSALGVNPVAMALSEVYTALETKVADGQDNPYATDRASSFFEVQKYILATNHMFSPIEWVINEKYYQSLPKELREVLDSCVKEAADNEWKLAMESEKQDKEFLKSKGMTITECTPEMRKQMIDKVTAGGVYDWLYNKYPGTKELAEEIRNFK